MPRVYPATVRRQIAQRLRSGELVAAIAAETGIAQATLFRWKRQALIDAGVIEGTPSVEADELAAARKRIAQLEAELTLTRDACELFNAEAVVPPKRRRAIVEGLIARGHSARSACRITGLTRSLLQYYRRRPVPDREMLREMKLLLLEEGHCFRDQALAFCNIHSVLTRELLDGSSLSTLVQMVGAGIGVTLIPEMAVAMETRSASVSIARFGGPQPSRTIGMIWRKTSPLARQLLQFSEVVCLSAGAKKRNPASASRNPRA